MSVPAHPQWIEKMYPNTTGRDHLGLGSVSSDLILPSLAPGIDVLTIHPRYHSFYTFLLDEFWRRDLPRTRVSFAAFYRPREFIFSLAAHLCDCPEHTLVGGIVGADKTAGLACSHPAAFDTTTNYIKSDLGGYGLYYRSVIVELGFVYPGDLSMQHKFDIPTDHSGKALAESFRSAILDTEYYRSYFDDDATMVPYDVVVEYARHACLCQLQRADAPDRPILLDAFLHAREAEDATDAIHRRQTLRLYLDIAAQNQTQAISSEAFRQLVYFGATSDGMAYAADASLSDTAARWKLYQAREYYTFALNALWCALADWGVARHGDARPLPMSEFHRDVDAALPMATICDALGVPRPDLSTNTPFEHILNWLCDSVGAQPATFDAHCGADAPINEQRLYELMRRGRMDQRITLAAPLLMLALVYLRFAPYLDKLWEPWKVARMGGRDRLSLHLFLISLRGLLRDKQPSIGEFARWLIAEYIILQHEFIAASKLPENTYRFQREGDWLRFFVVENNVDFMSARFEAISTTLHELGLCGPFTLPGHALSSYGAQLLREGDFTPLEVQP